jgi:choline dehydrogenase-like flavoprotein
MSCDTYDFIIVGAGPSGATLARHLAQTTARPSVLLLEAGTSDGTNDLARVAGNRFSDWLGNEHSRSMILPYETVPQSQLGQRKVKYVRGTGLGGTSAVNFAMWTIPPAEWHDEVARQTGNAEWEWARAKSRYRRLEKALVSAESLPAEARAYVDPNTAHHGTEGPISVGFPRNFEASLFPELEAWRDAGVKMNTDANAGHVMGLSVPWNSIDSGLRSTAADVLRDVPENLEILRDARVARVRFEGDVARGVDTIDGRTICARKEVILCAGSLDTPKLLMLSGIGPSAHLGEVGIPLLRANEHVGAHLQDHVHCAFVLARTPESLRSMRREYYANKSSQEAALQQWQSDHTGQLTDMGGVMGLAMVKVDHVRDTVAYDGLDTDQQRYLSMEGVPDIEVMLNGPNFGVMFAPDKVPDSQAYVIMLTNTLSKGSVKLQSGRPEDPALFDPRLFEHVYDQRVAVEGTRHLMGVLEREQYNNDTIAELRWPAGQRNEEILEYWQANAGSTWHPCGTAKVGSNKNDGAIDGQGRVWDVQRLRVADLSMLPLIPPTHPQTVAYMIGLLIGDHIIKQYGLEA